jgi:RecB family exonuclease
LQQNGVHLQSLDTKLSYLGETWLRPVMSSKNRIIFVLHYSDEEHHPLWDQITACSDGWIELDAEELIQSGKNIPELNVKSLPLEPKPLPPIKRWWKLRNGDLLEKREIESYSSLDAFIKSPYRWVLRYKAKLKEGSFAALPSGNLLKGSLVHRLIEDFFAENTKWIAMTDQNINQWINKRIPLLLEQEGALLLVPGQTVEKEAFVETSKRAIVALVSNLKGAGIKTVDVESYGKCNFVGGELAGFIDMLLTDKKKREIVLDVKWRGAKYRTQDLRENTQIQLATYAFIRKNITRASTWPPQAFFIIENAQILAQTKEAFPSAILCSSNNGEMTKELWSRIEETWKWRRNQMNKGMIEVTIEGAEPDDSSVPPDNGLILEDHYNNFNEFAILTGWGDGA